MTKDKEARKLRKDFGLADDLPVAEEESILEEYNAALGKKGLTHSLKATSDDLAAPAAVLAGVVQTAEKQGLLKTQPGEEGGASVSLKSFRTAQWRVPSCRIGVCSSERLRRCTQTVTSFLQLSCRAEGEQSDGPRKS
jgi:hypothetical protein